MIDWWGPIIHEYYAGTEGNGVDRHRPAQEWLAHPGSVGRAALGVLQSATRTGDELPAGETGLVYFEREQMRSTTTTTRTRPRAAQHPAHPSWTTPRRRRLPRRGGLPLPHRPQGLHDHLRRRQHLSAGDRGRADRPSQGGATSRCSACRTRRWARQVKAVVEPADGVAPDRRTGRRADRLRPRRSWPTTWCRARSTSSTRCRACRPASSTSRRCGPRTLARS